jgi:hypothetical protein
MKNTQSQRQLRILIRILLGAENHFVTNEVFYVVIYFNIELSYKNAKANILRRICN